MNINGSYGKVSREWMRIEAARMAAVEVSRTWSEYLRVLERNLQA